MRGVRLDARVSMPAKVASRCGHPSLPLWDQHSRAADLMDEIGELRDIYRERWDAEYTPYRRATALARFDAELEYWRRFQARVWEFGRTFRQGANWPALESFGR